MPNTEGTPRRSFRSPDAIWEPAKQVAIERRETLTDVLNRALVIYARTYGHGLIEISGEWVPAAGEFDELDDSDDSGEGD